MSELRTSPGGEPKFVSDEASDEAPAWARPVAGVGLTSRRYDVDWLRVGATGLVFLFHSGRFFDLWGWHVKNGETSLGMTFYEATLLQIIMPLFFVLSGISTYYALGIRQGSFLRERAGRLVVPLVLGILVLSPHQIYLERLTHGQFSGTFVDWLPSYFNGPYTGGGSPGNFAWMGVHLWYLLLLFLFSLALLPLLRWLRTGGGRGVADALVRALARPGMLFLPFLLLALAEYGSVLSPELRSLADMGGWNTLVYMLLFVYGFLLLSGDLSRQAALRQRRVSLAVGLLLMPTYGVLYYLAETQGYNPQLSVLLALLRTANTWAWMLALLGYAAAHLSFSSPFLRRANEAVLPFYILHQPVILLVGYFIVQWELPILVKYPLIMVICLPIILGLYGWVVSRVSVLRYLFGMKSAASASG